MLKNISKILIAGSAIVALQPLYSMEIYTVKSGDYLYKIAKSHTVNGISTGELTDSIKGINKSEVPGIVDNRIKIGDKLAIPTTKDEVEDGLTLVRNEMVQGTYNASNVSQTPKVIGNNNSSTADSSNLGDQAMVYNRSAATQSTQTTSSQNTVPNMMPNDDAKVVTYGSDLDSKINNQDIQETQSNDGSESSSIFSKLAKFIFVIIILLGLFIFGKRFWDSRNSKKEQELEVLSKKRRDHLMSRISPVVSDSDFYKADDSHQGPQEAFDFSAPLDGSRHSKVAAENIKDKDLEEKVNLESDINDLINTSENKTNEIAELVSTGDKPEDDRAEESITVPQNAKSTAVKTSKGMVFETASDDSFKKTDDLVEEIDSEIYEEDEMRYVEELVEQYLDGEKYMEASITVQDSLEKSPNNINLRFMLLEVYARAGDEIAFDGEVHLIKSKNIVSMFDPLHQKIAKLKDKYFE